MCRSIPTMTSFITSKKNNDYWANWANKANWASKANKADNNN